MKWLAPLALAACIFAQAPLQKLDIVPSSSELESEEPTAKPPRVFVPIGRLFAFTKWKGDESACATFYAIFEVGGQLIEVTLTAEECEV
jgi:hypothetical protein